MKIGITERGDAALDTSWLLKLRDGVVDGAIAVTKAPHILTDLTEAKAHLSFSCKPLRLPDNVVIHCTITGHGGTWLEPGVAPPDVTIAAYHHLVAKYGVDRVVLRVDPIIPDSSYFEQALAVVMQGIQGGRVLVSFMDMYAHVTTRWLMSGKTPPYMTFHAAKDVRLAMLDKIRDSAWGPVNVCAEPDMACAGCVSPHDVRAMGLDPSSLSGGSSPQRKLCRCVAEKTELLTMQSKDQCRQKHQCMYCYWR